MLKFFAIAVIFYLCGGTSLSSGKSLCPKEGGDKYSSCGYWKKLGFCGEEKGYFNYMKKNCPVSCGFCEVRPTPAPRAHVVKVNINECLRAHNSKRSTHGARPLTWDASLATEAQEWALYLANKDVFKHAPFTGAGENIIWKGNTAATLLTCKEAVEDWYSEVNNYPFRTPPYSVFDYNPSGQIGHFTQIVWKSTTKIGVGIAAIKRGYLTKTYIVARYTPPGNYEGQFKQQVGNSVWA